MTPEQIQTRSKEKVQQVLNLMKMLHLKVEGKQKISPQGFIENAIAWIDDEKYPITEAVVVPAGPIDSGEVKVEVEPIPKGATGEENA